MLGKLCFNGEDKMSRIFWAIILGIAAVYFIESFK